MSLVAKIGFDFAFPPPLTHGNQCAFRSEREGNGLKRSLELWNRSFRFIRAQICPPQFIIRKVRIRIGSLSGFEECSGGPKVWPALKRQDSVDEDENTQSDHQRRRRDAFQLVKAPGKCDAKSHAGRVQESFTSNIKKGNKVRVGEKRNQNSQEEGLERGGGTLLAYGLQHNRKTAQCNSCSNCHLEGEGVMRVGNDRPVIKWSQGGGP